MTEAIWVAIITNATVIIVAVLSRLWSHIEHRDTAAKVEEIHEQIRNGY